MKARMTVEMRVIVRLRLGLRRKANVSATGTQDGMKVRMLLRLN